ncbi:MAG TPA: SHOCT domain-containing protein, partial [Methylomirabilota bacterium]|nr:SHOCT domain-containing protein [Methylomirabilota bacterium]
GSRGYARDKQVDPPPPGSYRGIESDEEFNAVVQAAATGQGRRQGFEQQLAQLDDLKARGRITEDEYATMRKRLVDAVTPGALTPARPSRRHRRAPWPAAGTGGIARCSTFAAPGESFNGSGSR